MLVHLRRSDPNFREKMSAKLEYSMEMEMRALFDTNAVIYALKEGWTSFF